MNKIFKYELVPTDVQPIRLPVGAEILTVQMQRGIVCLWAVVDPAAKTQIRYLRVAGTGHPLHLPEIVGDNHYYFHLGTVQDDRTGLVWHVFEICESYVDPIPVDEPLLLEDGEETEDV